MKDLLTGKVILVTGGTQGLGAGIARAAAREGATLVLAGRNTERGEQVAAELIAAGAQASFVRADITHVAEAVAAVETTVDRHGRIDSLVNSAGLTARGTLLDTTEELFDRHVAINLKAPFFLMQAAVTDMVKRGAPGTILNIISIDSHGGQAFLAPYVAAKAGLAGLTRNARERPDPPRRRDPRGPGPHVCRRRRTDRGVPDARRFAASARCGMPAQGRPTGRRHRVPHGDAR